MVALITRGLGSDLLVTRGLGNVFEVTVVVPVSPSRPRQLRHRGGSGRREERCCFVRARLVCINGVDLPLPVLGSARVDYTIGETLLVRSRMPKVAPRKSKLLTVKARLV